VDILIVVLSTSFIWNGWLHNTNFTAAKKPTMKKAFITDTIAALFILLFVYAALSKLTEFHKFKIQLGQSPLLTSFTALAAWLTPAVEIIISLLLLLEKYRLLALHFSLGLMSMFTTYIITITKFSTYIPCSCGGILQDMTWNQHLLFNLGFVVLGFCSIIFYNNRSQPSSTLPTSLLQQNSPADQLSHRSTDYLAP